MKRPTTRLALMALTLAALVLLCGAPARASATPAGEAATAPKAPDFTLTLLDGKTLTLGDLKGKPVLVNFWWSQ